MSSALKMGPLEVVPEPDRDLLVLALSCLRHALEQKNHGLIELLAKIIAKAENPLVMQRLEKH